MGTYFSKKDTTANVVLSAPLQQPHCKRLAKIIQGMNEKRLHALNNTINYIIDYAQIPTPKINIRSREPNVLKNTINYIIDYAQVPIPKIDIRSREPNVLKNTINYIIDYIQIPVALI